MSRPQSLSAIPTFVAICACLGLAACAPPSTPRQADPVRLIDRVDRAAVEWPPAANTSRPGAILEAETLPAEIGRYAARVVMYGAQAGDSPRRRPEGHEDRLALLAPTPARYVFDLPAMRDARLRVGLGHAPDGNLPDRIDYTVTLRAAGTETVVLDETLSPTPDAAWLDRELALGAIEEGAQLVFDTDAPQGGTWAAWSNPEVEPIDMAQAGWNVVLISLDTLRADRLGAYGYERPTSPHLDRFAGAALLFTTAISQAPWTRPSHRALFTGLYPVSRQGLSSPPLAASLRRAGYRTRALTAGGQLHYQFGFQQGFDEYRITNWIRDVDDAAERILRDREHKQFWFLHTYEIHDPFTHLEFARDLPAGRVGKSFSNSDFRRLGRKLSAEEKEYVEALYDGGIAYVDRQIGRLLESLDSAGFLARSVVIVTSDHGEQFWEHGSFRHGQNMYDHQLHVPLIVYLPPELRHKLGGPAAEERAIVRHQVRLVDLYPTILELVEAPTDLTLHGRSLVPLLRGETMSDVDAFAENTNRKIEQKALRTPAFKFIQTWETEIYELYDLRSDAREQINLASEQPAMVEALAARLQSIAARGGSVQRDEELPDQIDPALRERLEALGYLGN